MISDSPATTATKALIATAVILLISYDWLQRYIARDWVGSYDNKKQSEIKVEASIVKMFLLELEWGSFSIALAS